MPSPNLAIPHVAASQNQKEVTINDAIDALDLAMTAALDVDFSAGGTSTVTETELRRNAAVVLVGTPSVPVTLQLPALRKFLYVQNTTGQAVTVGGPGGGITVPVGAGQRFLVYATGSEVVPIEAALGATPGSSGWDLNAPGETVWGTPQLDSIGLGVGQAAAAFGTGKFLIAVEGAIVR